jgi:hypothetical protein
VTEIRNGPSQGLVDRQLPKGAQQQVIAANDVVDMHVVIVDDHGQLVSDTALRTTDDEIAQVAGRIAQGLLAGELVDEAQPYRGHPKTPGERDSTTAEFFGFPSRSASTGTGVDRAIQPRLMGSTSHRLDFAAGTGARINQLAKFEFTEDLPVTR